VQVKDNQGRLLARLQQLSRTQPATDVDETVTRNRRGRQEHRTVETFDVAGQLDRAWDGLIVQAACVHRLTWEKQSATGRWTERNETAFYVCQVPLSAADFNEAVRAHWTIENRNHYVRDVTLGEDDSRIRVQPGPFTRIRSFALNIFRANGVRNVARARYAAMVNPDKLQEYAGS
jgi:predicted transposase YbfD/YdcC